MTPGPVSAAPAQIPDTARQHMVRMRDGIRLATDVYLPDGDGPFPAILVRLPYDKNSRYVFMEAVAARAVSAGYAFVAQDVRGKYRSEGLAFGPVNEPHDGYDTLSWIAGSEWSDGRVGMFGDSYYGYTQYAAASTSHPALRALVPRVTSTTIGIDDLVEGDGVRDIPWAAGATYLLQCWTGPYVNEIVPDYARRPLTAAFDDKFAELGERSFWYDSIIPHPMPGRVFPEGSPFDARPVPTLHCVGWWDNLATAHMRDFAAFAAVPGWAAVQYLCADSIDHESYHLDRVGDVAAGDHAEDDDVLDVMMERYLGPALAFFDVFVKGEGSADDIPRVRWHLAHEGYREAVSWPPPGATVTSLHLGGLAEMVTGRGTLSAHPPAGAERGAWLFDPDAPVPSPVASSWSYMLEYPDERATADRPDVAVFDSEPLTDDLDLAGPARLLARVASTAVTADVFVRVLDVDPDGAAHLVLRGQAEFTSPDETSLRSIELGHAGYRFRAGHRLRVQIASSDFPEYILNPGNGENRWLAADLERAEHTLTTDPANPVRLELTVLPPATPGASTRSLS